MVSVNTNSGAISALRNLEESTRFLESVQTRISTGLDVSSVKDNPATYTLAQRMRGDLAGLNATLGSIDRAIIGVDVAAVATESISDVLIKMKGTLLSFQDAKENGDTQAEGLYRDELNGYRDTIKFMIENASIGDVNLIDQGNDIISALASADGSRTIDFDHQNLAFGEGLITLSEDGDMTIEQLEKTIDNVNGALGHFGTAARRLEIQKEFTLKLQGVIESGIGRLVDTNLAKASVDLFAAQIKQQLGIASLNIANQAPKIALKLFERDK